MSKVEIRQLEIKDAFIVYGKRHLDQRGYFEEIYKQTNFDEPINFQQVSVAHSVQDTIRGIHCSSYAKFVQCIRGQLYDVIVDLRPDSPTFMKWQGVWLNGDSNEQIHLYVPKGCGHSFYCKKESYLLNLQTGVYNKSLDVELNPFDKTINIQWPKPFNEYILSEKDKINPMFEQVRPLLLKKSSLKRSLSNKPNFLIYGATGFLGNYAIKLLKNTNKNFEIGKARLENRESLEKEIKEIMPEHIICLAGIAGKPNISWCENNQIETIRVNLIGQLNIADISSKLTINCTLLTTGVIYKYDENHSVNSGKGFTEEDQPNFDGNFYSKLRIMEEQLLKSYPNVLNLRISYPISSDLNPKSLLNKLLKYPKIESVPIAVTVIDDLWPVMIDMTERKIAGTYNFNNPGTISHDEILTAYKNIVDKDHTWVTAEPNKNLAACELNVDKLLSLGYAIPNIKKSIPELIKKIKDIHLYKPKNILLTGGAGFIGSHVAVHLVKKYKEYNVIVYDILDSCSNIKNLDEIKDEPNFKFVQGDICDFDFVNKTFKNFDIDTVMHFAANSHVGLSLKNYVQFTDVNVKGTNILLENAYLYNVKRFIHVSTDEVYGTTGEEARHDQPLDPTNPYACTKTAAEIIIMAYRKCFKLPVIITRSNNVYGPNQYLEKVIPKFIQRLLLDKKCCIHGDGSHERDYLYVSDVVNAFDIILHKGEVNTFYNIGSNSVIKIIELAQKLIRIMNKSEVGKEADMIEFVEDRLMDDIRYRIECTPIKELGWSQKVDIDEGLRRTVEWFLKNPEFWSTKPDYDASVLEPHS